MNVVTIRNRRRNGKVVKVMLIGIVGFFTGIMFFVFFDGEELDFWYMLSVADKTKTSAVVWEETVEEFAEIGSTEEYDVSVSGTDGVGLNLSLINNITTNGYVKELLSLAAESQNGTLTTQEPLVPIELRTIIGIWRTETDVYNEATYVLKSYLPWDSANNSPMWNKSAYGLSAAQMTLKGCGKNEVNILRASGALTSGMIGAAIGPLQFEGGNSIMVSSKYVPSTGAIESTRTDTDIYYTPDQMASLTSYLQEGCNYAGITDEAIQEMSQDAIAVATAISHNRGAGAVLNDMLGCYYGSGRKYVDASDPENVILSLNELASDINRAVKDVSDYEALNKLGKDEFVFPLVVLMKSGWKIDALAKSWIMKYSGDGIAAWNLLNPEDPVSTSEELDARISPNVSTISQETGYSISECAAKYNINSDGSFRQFEGWSEPRGYVFKVTNRTSAAFTNGESKVVITLDRDVAQHAVFVCSGAYGLYAVLLRYAGVDVDLTNPETFFTKMQETGQWTGEIAQVLNELVPLGLDTAKLSAERANVLIAAYNLLAIQYHQCRGGGCSMGKAGDPYYCDGNCYNAPGIPTHIDCSAYIWRSYSDAGYEMVGFPTSTSGYSGSDVLIEISFEELKPGDMIWKSGHVMMFVGVTGDSVNVMHASSHGVPSCIASKSLSTIIGPGYKFYRFVNL